MNILPSTRSNLLDTSKNAIFTCGGAGAPKDLRASHQLVSLALLVFVVC
jgi:hypothetical protein